MALFDPDSGGRSPRHRRVWAMFEIIYTAIDFGAAVCFVAGSILFFYDHLQTAGTWLFLVGSLLFAAKPSLRLARELRLAALGDSRDLARRLDG